MRRRTSNSGETLLAGNRGQDDIVAGLESAHSDAEFSHGICRSALVDQLTGSAAPA